MGGCLSKTHREELSSCKDAAPVVQEEEPVVLPRDLRELVGILTDPTTSDYVLLRVVLSLTLVTRSSEENRRCVGTSAALQRMGTLVMRANDQTVVATLEVLRNLAINRSTHGFFHSACVVPALLHQLHHESYRISAFCLSTLRSVSVTPDVVVQHVGVRHKTFVSGVRRFLLQTRDVPAQLCASQFLLNICCVANVSFKLPVEPVSLLLIEALKSPLTDDLESCDMCAEALVTLISASDIALTAFRRSDGLAAMLGQARHPDVLSSTLVTCCEAVDVLVDAGFAAAVLEATDLSFTLSRALSVTLDAEDRETTASCRIRALKTAQKLAFCGLATPAQQLAIARSAAAHLADCLAQPSPALHLAAALLLLALADDPATRPALTAPELMPALVAAHKQEAAVPAAAVVAAIGRLAALDRAHADAAVRHDGVPAVVATLEHSTSAQAQRHALVTLTQVLRSASPALLTQALADGAVVDVSVLVFRHTGSGSTKVPDHEEWAAWCCRVLADVAAVDADCAARVVDKLAADDDGELRALLHMPPAAPWDAATVLPTLAARAEAASDLFIAKVVNSQLLVEAIATGLVKGRHPHLSRAVKPSAPLAPDGPPPIRRPTTERPWGARVPSIPPAQQSVGVLTQFGSTAERTRDITLPGDAQASGTLSTGLLPRASSLQNTFDKSDQPTGDLALDIDRPSGVALDLSAPYTEAEETGVHPGMRHLALALDEVEPMVGRKRVRSPDNDRPTTNRTDSVPDSSFGTCKGGSASEPASHPYAEAMSREDTAEGAGGGVEIRLGWSQQKPVDAAAARAVRVAVQDRFDDTFDDTAGETAAPDEGSLAAAKLGGAGAQPPTAVVRVD